MGGKVVKIIGVIICIIQMAQYMLPGMVLEITQI